MKRRETVLVVEDDEGVAYLQRQRLERKGYTVVTASTCDEAVARAQAGVDVVVLDYWLGHVTGLDVCDRFREAGLELAVVMVTGFSEEGTVIEALRHGVRDFVPKTSHYLDHLPEAVERVLQQQRTEKRLAELEARRQQGEKMEALGQLAGGVAHEFNNLLQVIQGFTEGVIEDNSDRADICEDLEEVLRATSRAATLTGQLLAFGRRQSMQMESVDLAGLIKDLMKMLRPLLGQDIKVEVHLDPELGNVWGCAAMIGQIIMNLCVNARDAMAGGGRLTLRCTNQWLEESLSRTDRPIRPGPYVCLQVADTGTGISPEHLPRLYEPFFTTKPVGRGTGLGLATVFGVVEEHEGTIDVQSTLGEGTTFTVYLPKADSASATLPSETPSATGGAETVLIAEDEDGVRQYLERVLSRAGYRVLTAADGEEAIEIFRLHEDEIQLLLLDMVMPKLSGRGVFQGVEALRPEKKFIFISGYDPASTLFAAEEGEHLQVLQKPVRRQDLLQTVRQLLDQPPRAALQADA